jgi:hypothetical protein
MYLKVVEVLLRFKYTNCITQVFDLCFLFDLFVFSIYVFHFCLGCFFRKNSKSQLLQHLFYGVRKYWKMTMKYIEIIIKSEKSSETDHGEISVDYNKKIWMKNKNL